MAWLVLVAAVSSLLERLEPVIIARRGLARALAAGHFTGRANRSQPPHPAR